MTSALVETATRKSGLVWVSAEGSAAAAPVWHRWHDGAMYVVTGGLEQPVPELPGGRAVVAVRSRERRGDLLVRWVAEVSVVAPGTETWDAVVPVLHAGRLNAPDGEEQPARWARESRVLRFAPTGEELPVSRDA